MLWPIELNGDQATEWRDILRTYRETYLQHKVINLCGEPTYIDIPQESDSRKRKISKKIEQRDVWIQGEHAYSDIDARFLYQFYRLLWTKHEYDVKLEHGDYKMYMMMKFVPLGAAAQDAHTDIPPTSTYAPNYWTFTFNCRYDSNIPLFSTDGFDEEKYPQWTAKHWPLALGFDGRESHSGKEQTDEYKNCKFIDDDWYLRFFVVLCPAIYKDPNLKNLRPPRTILVTF